MHTFNLYILNSRYNADTNVGLQATSKSKQCKHSLREVMEENIFRYNKGINRTV